MTPEKLESAREILLALPDDADPAEVLYLQWFHQVGKAEVTYPDAGACCSATLHPDSFETGWRVTGTGLPGHAAQIEVGNDARTRIVAPPNVAPEDPSATAFVIGMPVAVNPYASMEIGGFWHLLSPGWQDAPPPVPRRRLYFGVTRGQETAFLRAAAQHADPDETWSLKTLTGSTPEGRCDPCVVYLPGTTPTTAPWLTQLIDAVEPFLGPVTVPGTRRLRDGVAEAPDLDDEQSFGQRLCGVLAALPIGTQDWADEARARLARIGAVAWT